MPPLMIAILAVMTEAPGIIKNLEEMWTAFATFHNAAVLTLTADQLAAMNAAGVTLDAAIAKLDADAAVAAAAEAKQVAAAKPVHFGA